MFNLLPVPICVLAISQSFDSHISIRFAFINFVHCATFTQCNKILKIAVGYLDAIELHWTGLKKNHKSYSHLFAN